MLLPLDGPSKQFAINPTNSTPIEAKAGASAWEARKVITLQPTDGDIYVYFADESENPSATDLQTKGFIHYKYAKDSYEASDAQAVWVLGVDDTTNVRGAERA